MMIKTLNYPLHLAQCIMFILDEFDVVQLDDSLAKEDNQTNSYNKFMTYKTIFDLIQF